MNRRPSARLHRRFVLAVLSLVFVTACTDSVSSDLDTTSQDPNGNGNGNGNGDAAAEDAAAPATANDTTSNGTTSNDTTSSDTTASDGTAGGSDEAGNGTTSTAGDDRAQTPDGFESVAATVTDIDGAVCDVCLWLADDGEARSRGLMLVDDLGDADGMAFVYPEATERSFWMKNTLLPLSIAFFDPDGRFVDAFDMEPCTTDPCPSYPTPEMIVAVEVPQGELAAFGIGPGSTLTLTDTPCR